MRARRVWGLLASAVILSGCTHISTTPDLQYTAPDQALGSASYSLPMLQYDLELTRTLTKCPTQKTLAGVTFVDPTLTFKIEAKATGRYVKGESYHVDYETLSAWWKTSSFGIERWPSGTLKAFNAAADDQVDEIAKAGVKTGLLVASLAAGPATATAAAAVAAAPAAAGPSLEQQRLQALLTSSLVSLPIVTCNDNVAAMVAARAENREASKAAVENLEANTKRITNLTNLASLKALDPPGRAQLNGLVQAQTQLSLTIAKLDEDLVDLDNALSAKDRKYWPRIFTEDTGRFPLPDGDKDSFKALLDDTRTLSVLDNATFTAALKNLSRDELLKLRKAFPNKLDLYIDAYGAVHEAPKPVDGCQGVGRTADACLTNALKVATALLRPESGLVDCKARETGECLTKVAYTAPDKTDGKQTPLVVKARDGEADKGIFVREAGEAKLVVCKGDVCDPKSKNLVSVDTAYAPQFGQLRFLPFENGLFQANELSVLVTEDGRIQKIEYKHPKAAGQRFAATAADIASQLDADRRRKEKEQSEADAAARAERAAVRSEAAAIADADLADWKRKIDLINQQRAYDKLLAPTTPDAFAAQNEEIARNQKEAAVLESRIAIHKAVKTIQENGYPAL